MSNKKPSAQVDEIIRKWLEKLYNKDGTLFLSIVYSKISPPEGTATFSGGFRPFNVVFECAGAITLLKSPFTFIRGPGD